MKKAVNLSVLLLSAIILMGSISAFAVSSAYYKDSPISVLAGEKQDIQMVLQNTEASDIMIQADVTNGNDVIKILDSGKKYLVPANGRTYVNLEVAVPSDAEYNHVYNVNIVFTEISAGASRNLGLTSSIGQSFDVVAGLGESPSAPLNMTILLVIVIAILVAIALAFFIFRSRNRKKR